MKKLALIAATASFTLAACGSADDSDATAGADSVEVPAEEVMTQPGMDEDPAVDPAKVEEPVAEETAEPAPAPKPTSTGADAVADAAADAADDLQAALAE